MKIEAIKRAEAIDVSILIGGKAGDGVLFTGNILARLLKRYGWWAVTYRDFPSNIRGEGTQYVIRASLEPIENCREGVDIFLAFDCEAIKKHAPRLNKGALLLCDGADAAILPTSVSSEVVAIAFPLRQPAKEKFGKELYKNMMAIGALSYLLGLEVNPLEDIVRELFFEKKGEAVVETNLKAVYLGYELGQKLIPKNKRWFLPRFTDNRRMILMGDEAVALGALAAGCRFFAAYPICPASEIWQWLAPRIKDFGGVVVQVEDELAALNMAIGAAYAGARAMTATSGPGASLMMEAFSLAGMIETPVVIAHVQRVGPSTGLPTKTQQGDLLQWIFGAHGEFPRIVLAPGSIEECFTFTVSAFNLAEKLQGPVVILLDLDLGQNLRTTHFPLAQDWIIDRGKLLSADEVAKNKEYKRYLITEDGISPRTFPGISGGIHLVESVEHGENGLRSEDPEIRKKMMEKRMRKLLSIAPNLIPPIIFGPPEAEIAVIGVGSTKGPILEALKFLREEGIQAKFFQVRTLWPFPTREVSEFLQGTRQLVIVENNYTGQLLTLLQSQVCFSPNLKVEGLRKYLPDNFTPEEIYRGLKQLCQ
ncbi:MAG: 2-oxoacid:acceptor oxidoreductase subunit alpha [Candidatus Aminicenantes bacterium]|nr:2-oxoacid:acceptor oxidoreductase subunit alpha [Candidatus Aminicenantes bacterium]